MFKKSVLFACFTSLLMLLSPPPTVSSQSHCDPSSCGIVHNITDPFRLKSDPSNCGLKEFELSCDKNNRTILQLYSRRFYVMAINYTSSLIRVVDPGIQKDNCSAWPLYSLTDGYNGDNSYYLDSYDYNKGYTFVNCSTKVNSSGYIDTAVCSNTSENTSFTSPLLQTHHHTYVVSGSMLASDVEDSCTIGKTVWASNLGPEVDNTSLRSIHDGLAYGFELHYWIPYQQQQPLCFSRTLPFFNRHSFRCIWVVLHYYYIYIYASIIIALAVAARAVCGIPCFFAFLVYKWRRRHLSMYQNIEDFIQSHNM